MKKLQNIPSWLLTLAIAIILWLTFGIMNAVLFVGIYNAFMWLNLTITTVSNALMNNHTDKTVNLMRWLHILTASICFGICLI